MSKFVDKTEEILNFLSMVPKNSNKIGQFEIDMIKGKVVVKGMINNENLSVAQTFASDNCESN